jgi:putative two-component system response regulator
LSLPRARVAAVRTAIPKSALAAARILVLDDQPQNLALLTRLLNGSGYSHVETTVDPFGALAAIREKTPDLLVLDLHLPGLDGLGVLEQLAEHLPPRGSLPVLVVTGDRDPIVKQRALQLGARDFIAKPFNPIEVVLRIDNLVEARMLYLQLEEQNRTLESLVRVRTRELEDTRHEILDRLALAAEYRDDDTGDHARRVGQVAGRIAAMMGLSPAEVELIERAAPLHDIGKIGVSDAVLLKTGPLTDAEFAVIRMHTVIGAEILSGSRDPLLQTAEQIARAHHERWDGKGYPGGLSGTDIPLAGRITAVADALDVMTHGRRYGPIRSEGEAIAEIERQRGSQFDPAVVDALLRLKRKTGAILAA